MSTREEHLSLLNYSMKIELMDSLMLYGKVLSPADKIKLRKQAYWLNAMYTKRIEPITQAQALFISKSDEVKAILKSNATRQRQALKDIEKSALNDICKIFLKYKILQTLLGNIPGYSNKRYNSDWRGRRRKKKKIQYKEWKPSTKRINYDNPYIDQWRKGLYL